MKKIILLCLIFTAVFLFCLSSGAVAVEGSDIGFQEKWFTADKDFKKYNKLYIYGVNLQEMLVRRIEVDGNTDERLGDEVFLVNIANNINEEFTEKINPVLPVFTPDKKIKSIKELKGERALILDIKLSYGLTIEDRGLFTQLVSGKRELEVSPRELTIECKFTDGDSGRPVLLLSQSLDFSVEDSKKPFSSDKESEELNTLIRIWARRLANLLAIRR